MSIPNALPLKILQQTHNGWDIKRMGGEPDPRFAPLIIVMNPMWANEMPGYVKARIEDALKWTVDTTFPEMHWMVNTYFAEWGLRHYLAKALIPDDVFDKMTEHMIANIEEATVFTPRMAKVVDGKLVVDLTKDSGPFYLDGVIATELHYGKRMRNLSADQIP